MAITWVALTNSMGISNATTLLAAAYESRATAIARLFVPTVSFAGDTAQTATDGSFNTNNASVLRSATAVLATPTNILGAGNAAVGTANQVTAKPLIIKVRRDPFTGDILNYGVFNADGSVPGQVARYTPGMPGDPFIPDSGVAANDPRYLVNRMRGEVYLHNGAGIAGVNLDSATGPELTPAAVGEGNVIAIVEFKALEGAALSAAQQAASELSNVIQSLATLIRGFKDSERNLFSAIR